MPDFYIAKADLPDFFDLSRVIVLVEKPLSLKHVCSGELWDSFSVRQDDDGQLRISRNADEGVVEWEKGSFFGPNISAIVLHSSSKLIEAIEKNAFAPVCFPSVIIANDAIEGVGRVMDVLIEEHRQAAKNLTAANAALSEARQEAEITHEAMAAALRSLGGQASGEAQILLSINPNPNGLTYTFPDGLTCFRQLLPAPLEGLTAVALYFTEAASSSYASSLTVRLRSADTETIFGSWVAPADQLTVGWRNFDLRTVIGPIFETALLEIEADIVEGDRLTLALDSFECEDYVQLTGDHVIPPRHGLCLRLFRAQFGARNLLPRFWNWDETGAGADDMGLAQKLPSECWQTAEALSGDVEFVSVGTEHGRPVAMLTSLRPAVVRLVNVELKNSDLIDFEFSVMPTSSLPIRIQTTIEEVDAAGAVGRQWTSDWKTLPQNCDRSTLSMQKADDLERMNLVVHLRLDAEEGSAAVEWSSVAGLKLADKSRPHRNPVPPDAAADALFHVATQEPARTALRAAPLFSGIEIDHVLNIGEADYSHIDLQIYDLRTKSDFKSKVRLKLVKRGDEFHLEFRRLPDWPTCFEQWPGTDEDSYGPYFKLFPEPQSLLSFRARTSDNDSTLLDSLLAALPRILAVALNDPKSAHENAASWKAKLRQFIEAIHAP